MASMNKTTGFAAARSPEKPLRTHSCSSRHAWEAEHRWVTEFMKTHPVFIREMI